VADRKQLDFGVACHAGNTSRFCKPREKEKETDGGRKRVSLLAARRLRRYFADDGTRRGRIEWLERKERERERKRKRKRERERERLKSKRAFITGRTS